MALTAEVTCPNCGHEFDATYQGGGHAVSSGPFTNEGPEKHVHQDCPECAKSFKILVRTFS